MSIDVNTSDLSMLGGQGDVTLDKNTFTLGYLAQNITHGNLVAMARQLNKAGLKPRLDEAFPAASTRISKSALQALVAGKPKGGELVESQLFVLLKA